MAGVGHIRAWGETPVKTYLIVWFNSNGDGPTKVTERLLSMGFRPVGGHYDYVYEWHENAPLQEIIKIGDKIQSTLQGMGVTFRLETTGLDDI